MTAYTETRFPWKRVALEGYATTSLEWIEGVTVTTHLCGRCGTKYCASDIDDGCVPAKCPNCGSFVAKGIQLLDENHKPLPEERTEKAVSVYIYLVDEMGYVGPHAGFDPRIPPEQRPITY